MTVVVMVPCLFSLDGNADIRLEDPLTLVGRCRDCDICLEWSRVSRRHCCLASAHGEVLVLDLGSTNGTWINGRRIEKDVLRPGDVLGIAHLRFRLIILKTTKDQSPNETHRDNDAAGQR